MFATSTACAGRPIGMRLTESTPNDAGISFCIPVASISEAGGGGESGAQEVSSADTKASSAGRSPASLSIARGRRAPAHRTRFFGAIGTSRLASPNRFIPP